MLPYEIEHKIIVFDITQKGDKAFYKKLNRLISQFVKTFPVSRIPSLEFDEYIVGKGSKTSFCNRIENQLNEVGNMHGATSTKFGVYHGKWGKTSPVIDRYVNKYGKSVDEAFVNVKKSIVDLLESGKTKDRDVIIKSKIAPIFRYKLLGTYYPDKFLNIYSEEHLNWFIAELGLNNTSKHIYDKQNVLLDFKASDKTTDAWSNIVFNNFLYSIFGAPSAKKEENKKLNLLPPIEKVNPVLVNFEIIENKNKKESSNKGPAKPDYKEQQDRNSRLGKRGENIVFNWEKSFLKQNNFQLSKLNHVSLKNDRLGYDIESVDINEKKKYIEVKATRRKMGDANFIITYKEKEKAEKLDNYFIYVVFEAHTLNPKIWQIEEPFKTHQNKFKMSPVNYRVEIAVEK